MSRGGFLLCTIATALGLSVAWFEYKRSDIAILAALTAATMLMFALLAYCTNLRTRWRSSRWRSVLPLVVTFGAIAVLPLLGVWARDAYFRSRLPELHRYAVKLAPMSRPPEVPGFSNCTYAEDGQGEKVVYFWWANADSAKHEVLAYVPADSSLDDPHIQGRWVGIHKVADHWYDFRD